MERTFLQHRHQQEIIDPHAITSQASCASDSGTTPNNDSHNEGSAQVQASPVPLPPTPKAVFRSDNNPYPTTFVQADTSNFKQVVQMLTGPATTTEQNQQQQRRPDPSPSLRAAAIPPIRTVPKKQQGFRLYERRNSLKNALMINTLPPGFSSPSDAAITLGPGLSPRNLFPLSPSMLNFPKLTLSSPVTPLNADPFGKSSLSSEEDRAIAERGFYFHPSQVNTQRDSEPQLLPLFPVTSPKISDAPS